MILKTKIYQKLKVKYSDQQKLGITYDFLNKNLIKIGDKLVKNKFKCKKEINDYPFTKNCFQILKNLICIEEEIIKLFLLKSKILM